MAWHEAALLCAFAHRFGPTHYLGIDHSQVLGALHLPHQQLSVKPMEGFG